MAMYEDLGDPELDAIEEALEEDPVADLYEADEEAAPDLDDLITKIILFCEVLAEMEFRPYQRKMAYRLIESLIIEDAETLTGLWSRQSGKSETVATVLAGCMVCFPVLANTFEVMKKFKKGLWVGIFAPTDDQSKFVHGKILDKLTSKKALELMGEPDISEEIEGKGRRITLKSGSYCFRQTVNPKAKIEGDTCHVLVVDEAQDADDVKIRKSVMPMLASVAGTALLIGTPTYHKGHFYKTIQQNKRKTLTRKRRQNHFEFDWRVVARYNKAYGKFVRNQIEELGEDSDEIQMSYFLMWQLDRGMLTTERELDQLADPQLPLVTAWHRSPCVAGIDVASIHDSTVVTVCWVDWDGPVTDDGFKEHRILNWLEIRNTDWEDQYPLIADFLANYNLAWIGVDAQGVGGPVAARLEKLFRGQAEVIPMPSDVKNQADRWKSLMMMLKKKLILYPGHSRARKTIAWKRFRQQMEDAEKVMKGGYILVQAPDGDKNAHDDYVDSLALAIQCTMQEDIPVVESMEAPWW